MSRRHLVMLTMDREPIGSSRRHTRVIRALIIPLLLALMTIALAACGDDEGGTTPVTAEPAPTPAPTTTVAPIDLDGRDLVLQSIDGHQLVPDTTIRLSFDGGTLSTSAGCNTIFGDYQLDADRLKAPALGTTEMACEPALMGQDRWLADIFQLEPRVSVNDDPRTVTFRVAGGATLTFVDRSVAEPDAALIGTRWMLDSLRTADAMSTVPAGVTATITFEPDRAIVEAGCNRGSAPVTIGEDSIIFGPLALTQMMCEDAAMEVEAAMNTVLDGEVRYRIDGDSLTLDSADTGTGEDTDDSTGVGEMTGTGLVFVAESD